MSDARLTISALMRSLIDGTFGCYDSAAETLLARWGDAGAQADKGAISRKLNGSRPWTVCDVLALEDAAGRYPVTRFLAKRIEEEAPSGRSMLEHAGGLAREAGEAVAALLASAETGGPRTRAQAVKELLDVEEAARTARLRLEAREV